MDVKTVTCTDNVCQVQVPAPGFALVFLTDEAYSEVTPEEPQTFATSALTKTHNTATVDKAVLATSNGHSGSNRMSLYGTSHALKLESKGALVFIPSTIVSAVTIGAILVGRYLWRGT